MEAWCQMRVMFDLDIHRAKCRLQGGSGFGVGAYGMLVWWGGKQSCSWKSGFSKRRVCVFLEVYDIWTFLWKNGSGRGAYDAYIIEEMLVVV